MPRPSQLDEKRSELLPVIARAFAELGYRRTTTAELAKRCEVQENILYRIWPDKKAMFIASIEYVYELSKSTWSELLGDSRSGSSAERLLEYESKHFGEFGHVRILFAGLNEADDPDIRKAMAQTYSRFQKFITDQIVGHRKSGAAKPAAEPSLAAWAIIGLGTVVGIARELRLLDEKDRRRLMSGVGKQLLG